MRGQHIAKFFLVGFLFFGSSQELSSASQNAPPASEKIPEGFYAVYNGVLREVQLPKKNPMVGISARTLNLKCGEESGNPVLVNGCGGFFMPPHGIKEIHELLKENFGTFSASAWSDFQAKNQFSVQLADEFHTAGKHEVIDYAAPQGENTNFTDDCIFYFSQPGFSREKKEAIVFVLVLSYMDGVPSTGDYFLLRFDEAKGWQVKGRVQYYKTGTGD